MASTIQTRRDTAANWTSVNPVLAIGEMGLETDTLKIKFGDGVTAWSGLAYYSAPAAAHALGGSEHTADTLANLNSKVSDATLIDTGDARLSDARTPTSHAFAGAEHSASTLAQVNAKVSDATLIDTGDARLSDDRNDASAIHDNVAAEISAVTEKVTPVSGDFLLIEDSAAANAKKRVQIGNLPGGGSAVTVEDEGTPLTTDVTKFNFVGDGVTVTEPVADQVLVTISGAGASGDQPGLQMKRTTDDVLTTTEANITFDSTPFENDTAIIEHNNTNTDRMEIKETGAYLLGINLACDNTANIGRVLTLRLRIDDTTTAATLVFDMTKSATEVFSRTIPVNLTAGTYVTIDAKGDNASDLVLKADSVMWAVRMSGATGATGPAGIAGADGDITWEGNWVSQNYTANQAVKYTDGNSYVCHTNTVSSEVPTNASFWDVLAEKGDAGSAQSRIDISVHPHNDDKKSTASATYVSQARFLWGGSTLLGTPAKIYSNSYQDAAGSGNVRVYDLTNAQVIAESASITSTSSGNIVDLGTISNVSAGQAVWLIENKGDGTNVNNVSSVSLEF